MSKDKVLEEMDAHLENLLYLKEHYLNNNGFELDKLIDLEVTTLKRRMDIYKLDLIRE